MSLNELIAENRFPKMVEKIMQAPFIASLSHKFYLAIETEED